MGHSQAEKAQSHERILDAAAAQMREGGIASVSIGGIMKSAQLTHGGFYGHFASRDALIVAAVERALDRGEIRYAAPQAPREGRSLRAFVEGYLSPRHRDNATQGCPMATLVGDVARSEDEAVRAPMARRLEDAFQRLAAALGGGQRGEKAAVVAWCTMIGALTMSRVFRGERRANEILSWAQESVLGADTAGPHDAQAHE
jgi:TetR/AcrR family transcriptional repressor of nem operon